MVAGARNSTCKCWNILELSRTFLLVHPRWYWKKKFQPLRNFYPTQLIQTTLDAPASKLSLGSSESNQFNSIQLFIQFSTILTRSVARLSTKLETGFCTSQVQFESNSIRIQIKSNPIQIRFKLSDVLEQIKANRRFLYYLKKNVSMNYSRASKIASWLSKM